MQRTTKHTDVSAPQTVTEFIKLNTGQKTIQIGFTDQKVSPYAGLATFAGFLHWHRFRKLLGSCLPHAPRSNNALVPVDIALGFLAGILSGARKLAQVSYLRRDVLLAPVLEIQRVASQSTLSRFFAHFGGAAGNLRTFQPLWHWCMDRLCSRPGGYTLDLDSTQLVHEDNFQSEGVKTGHTPLGFKRCWNPVLAFLAESRLVVGFWLRPGNTVTYNNAVGFTLSILEQLPRQVRIGLAGLIRGFIANNG